MKAAKEYAKAETAVKASQPYFDDVAVKTMKEHFS